MVTLYMANVKTLIHGLPSNLMLKLADSISYQVGGFGVPSEKKSLIDIQTSTTYTGVVPKVLLFLKQHGIPFKTIDKREVPKRNASFKIKEGFTPRDYQQEIIDGASSREIIQCATGGGKTFIMANLIAKHNVKPVVVIAPKVSLAEQIQEEFTKFLEMEIGIVGGGMNDIKDITVCTPQSAPKELLESASMVLYDECMKYDTKVLMEDGTTEKIGKLVDEKSTKKVMSYNHQSNKMEPKKIISHSKTPLKKNNKKLMKLTIKKADGTVETIECTDNHKIWIESLGKYVKAGDLVKGQKIKALKKKD